MKDFVDAHYNNDFRSELGEKIPKEERRRIFAEQAAARQDVTARGLSHTASMALVDEERSLEPTPEYLDSEDYKNALDEYRKLLAPTRKPRLPTTKPQVLDAAKLKLRKIGKMS